MDTDIIQIRFTISTNNTMRFKTYDDCLSVELFFQLFTQVVFFNGEVQTILFDPTIMSRGVTFPPYEILLGLVFLLPCEPYV